MSNVMGHIKLCIIINLHGIVKLIIKLIPLDSKLRRVILVLILSNIWTAKANIKLISPIAHSGSTDSTKNSTQKNTLSLGITRKIQFVQLWTVVHYDFEEFEDFFTKCQEKQLHHQHYSWSQFQLWHYLYPRTILDYYQNHFQLRELQRYFFGGHCQSPQLAYIC